MRRALIAISAAAAVLAASCGGSGTAPPTSAPSQTASLAPSPSRSATPTATPVASDRALVYFARDRLPPVAAHVDGAGSGATVEARILSRVAALFTAPAPPGLFNTALAVKARPASARVDADLVTIDFTVSGDWGTAGSTGTRAFVQQLVYTATEEPGIRRVMVTENGRQAVIGGEGLVIDHPAAREDVAGYAVRASTDPLTYRAEPRPGPIALTSRVSVDAYAPALVRFVVDTGLSGADAKAMLGFTASVMRNDERAFPELGKWVITLALPNARTTDEALRAGDRTPLRAVRTTANETAVRYDIGLDDLRPWRLAVLYEPLRVVLDIGGDPDAVSANIALYRPAFGASVRAGDEISGLLRAFEARYEYRIADAQGHVVDEFASASLGTSELWGGFRVPVPAGLGGAATITIQLRSPRDGSVSESAFVSVEIVP